MLYMYIVILILWNIHGRVRRIAIWMALLPIKFQTGSARAYTQEYMELRGVLLYLFNINSYGQYNLICDIGNIIPFGKCDN